MRFGKHVRTGPKRKIIVPLEIFHKLYAYIQACEGEISGFGKTKVEEKGKEIHITLIDVMIFKQEVHSAHTSLRGEDLARWYVDLARADEDPTKWNCWWHSHNDFGVFFSHEDRETIDKLCKESKLYSICMNKKADVIARYDENAASVDEDVEVTVDYHIPKALTQACKEEVAKKVKFVESPIMTSITSLHRPLPSYGPNVTKKDIDDRFVNYFGKTMQVPGGEVKDDEIWPL